MMNTFAAALSAKTSTFSVNPLPPHTAAEIRGIDLSQPQDSETREQLNRTWAEYPVVAFRDQTLTAQQLFEAVQNFGEVFPQHNSRFQVPECPTIHYISNQDKFADGKTYIPGEGFHTDHSNDVRPPKATILHAIKLPSTGGDTQFINMYRAYDDLPDDTKRRIDKLRAIHVYQSSHSERKLMNLSEEKREVIPNAVLHPLVRTHPVTGRKALYINPIRIEGIVELAQDEALSLLDELLTHSTQPQYEYRHKWQAGDLVMWDNRCLMHKANGDYDMNEVRYLHRIMLKGEIPG
jgi:taurine dioxygenase